MNKLFLLPIFLFALFLQPALAQTPSPQEQQLGEWMVYYYVDKDNSKVHDFLKLMEEIKILDKNEGAQAPTMAFLSVIFSNNQSQIDSLLAGIQFTGNTKKTVARALWLSGNGEKIEKTFEESPEYIKSSPVKLEDMTLKMPSDLDMMWGAFSASGNDLYVRKIIDVLDDSKPLTGDAKIDMATRMLAEWSIGSNMMQHELVRKAVLREEASHSGIVKEKLKKIISQAHKDPRPFPNRDGDFGAMLIVIADKDLKEFEKPSDQGMHFTEVAKAKRGDIVATKIVFAGMELSDDLMADVTYDFKLLDPDGQVYDGMDSHDLVALKRKMPMRFRIFDNQSYIKIGFEPKDKLGKYKIVAEVTDNIGKKKVLLEKEIELVSD